MTKSDSKKQSKKIWKYLSNLLFVLIILILVVPSWRVSFQGWFQSFFLDEVTMTSENLGKFPDDQRNWEIFNMNGDLINFNEFSGEPIVLNFWATWCSSCRAELPQIQGLKNEVKAGIKFMSISEENIDLINDSGLPDKYDFLYCSQTTPSFFNVTAYPTLAILDKNWNLVYRSVGAGKLNNDKNINFLNSLLEN